MKENTEAVFNKYFNKFCNRDRSLSGNKLYTFPGRVRRVFLRELLGKKLTLRDESVKDYWGIK